MWSCFPRQKGAGNKQGVSRTELAVTAKLNAAVLDALKDPDIKTRLETAVEANF